MSGEAEAPAGAAAPAEGAGDAAAASAIVYRFSPTLDATVRTVGKNTTTNGTIAAGTICGGPWGPQLRLVSRTGAGSPSGGTITQTVRIMQWQEADGR